MGKELGAMGLCDTSKILYLIALSLNLCLTEEQSRSSQESSLFVNGL